MKLLEALQNALEFMEANGYKNGGDIHDDLQLAIHTIQNKFLKVGNEEILSNYEKEQPTNYIGEMKHRFLPRANSWNFKSDKQNCILCGYRKTDAIHDLNDPL